ncbi:AAA family ATPase [uncultured Phascolarctobacterium sp.]|uniref:AAA family ATPase n=1 Tax=uncultured Phascolarctobacterium sp. TaxID=512296 RepID=UPI0025F7AF84|nr:AAA family ATPase [uncultured Phascolarctobacterium sp.]
MEKKSAMQNMAAKPAIRLPLPIGVADYRLASTEYYYIDKTLMIKEFLDERPMVSLFTRPRRFGKTLNMDMLRTFFEKTAEDTSVYFRDKAIWQCGERYRSYQGKYPVIFLTFKDVKFTTWQETFQSIRELIAKEAYRHLELKDSDRCDAFDKKAFLRLQQGNADETELANALADLSLALHKHYGIAPIIIIDEYDIPIQQGYMQGFYDKVILFMRNLFSGGLKDNKHLSYGFLTGILRVAKESIFSGLNNLVINSVLDNKYSEYFGFTASEVQQMAAYYGVADKYAELCAWYDGYRFGRTEIFNPWSVINYFNSGCEPRAFWQTTGSNDIIGEIIGVADAEIYERLTSLVNGRSFVTYIDTSVIYPQIKSNPSSIYSFLLVAGYLKVLKTVPAFSGDFMCEVALPNKEIAYVYNKEILQKLDKLIPMAAAILMQEALYSADSQKLKAVMQSLLANSVSSFDTAGENFYHGFMLGLCALLSNAYVTSNREAGDGRYDIQLMPKNVALPGILIELKAEKHADAEQLKKLAAVALKQIHDKNYAADMQSHGVKTIYKYGVAFSGKKVEIEVGE